MTRRRPEDFSGPEFDASLRASASHQEILDKFEEHDDRLNALDANSMVRFGAWLGPWRNRIAWTVAVIVGFYALLYAVDRLHEVFNWIPDVIVHELPTPTPTPR